MISASRVARWWSQMDRPAVRAFFLSMAALSLALLLALYSGAAAETGHRMVAGAAALAALAVSAWVAVTLVPILARRTPLRWFAYRIEYKPTREGWFYVAGVMVVALAALNTGNNLLFLILSSLIAVILMSGLLSAVALSGVELKFELPEHIFAGEPVGALLELHNEKQTLPSFSLRVEGKPKREGESPGILKRPIYFYYLPRRSSARQRVELVFPKRGVYRQDAFQIVTQFPFGFLRKARQVESQVEAVVYPSIEPTEEFYEILPLLTGELESFSRGRGHDLYALRDYRASDDARFVHWKATARSGSLKVREFTREDERRVLLVFDPYVPAELWGPDPSAAERKFERAVTLCSSLAWHFYESNSLLQFRTAGAETQLGPASEIIFDVLRLLAFSQPVTEPAQSTLISSLGDDPDLFKIILTGQPRGSIPTSVWSSSYIIFLPSL